MTTDHLYEELRKATDGGSESMTHADALKQIAFWENLEFLVRKVYAAKGRYHNQHAMCDLYDACGLPNVRP